MPLEKHLEAQFVDMKEILGRIDERVKTVIDSQMHLTERFDKFMVAHTDLVERVARLEAVLSGSGKMVEEVEDQYHSLRERMHAVEISQNVIEEYENLLQSLNDRVSELERATDMHTYKMDRWSGRVVWIGEVVFKCAWVMGMGWLLWKFGLGGVNFPP
jgi:predicted nuclease with TOPRIM domain